MFELVITVCSLVQGANCRELPAVKIEQGQSVMACVMASQIESARWVGEHPNYYVHRMTCQPAGRFAKA